ncbi:MAG: hypothetical protein ACREP5_13785, partial [Candidatus Binatia bacterium]
GCSPPLETPVNCARLARRGLLRINLADRKIVDAAYTQELKVLEPKFEIKPVAIQATLDEIARTDPRAAKVSPQQLIDRRYLEEMERSGFFDSPWGNKRQ